MIKLNTVPIALPLVLSLITWLTSCVEYSPYEVNPAKEDMGLTAENLEHLKRREHSGDTVSFIFTGDTQGYYEETEEFVSLINRRHQVDFVLIAGDITDFGLQDEYNRMADIFREIKVPYLTVIGNHDLIYHGREIYEKMYGPLNYSFIYNDIKFIMINTNSREFRFNGNVPDISWLRRQLEDTTGYSKAIVVGHVPPNHNDFDPELVPEYYKTIRRYNKTNLALHAHVHDFSTAELNNDGITYMTAYSLGSRYYTLLKVWPGGFTYENFKLQ